jgi:hypothetical protein
VYAVFLDDVSPDYLQPYKFGQLKLCGYFLALLAPYPIHCGNSFKLEETQRHNPETPHIAMSF